MPSPTQATHSRPSGDLGQSNFFETKTRVHCELDKASDKFLSSSSNEFDFYDCSVMRYIGEKLSAVDGSVGVKTHIKLS